MSIIEQGARVFAEAAAASLAETGLTIGPITPVDEANSAVDDEVVIVNVGGAWHGAIALQVDTVAAAALAQAMFGKAVDDPVDRAEALIEATNIAAGRGVAAVAGIRLDGNQPDDGSHKADHELSAAAVWLTPPIHARGPALSIRLHNAHPLYHQFAIGDGCGAFVFAAAVKEH